MAPGPTCSGVWKSGKACLCLRFIRRSDDKNGRPRRCRDCNHTESCHPEPPTLPLRTPMQELLDRLRRTSPPSLSAAKEETNAGLISTTMQPTQTSGSRGKSQNTTSNRGVNREASLKVTRIGTLLLIPTGLKVRAKPPREYTHDLKTVTRMTVS